MNRRQDLGPVRNRWTQPRSQPAGENNGLHIRKASNQIH